MHEHDIYDITCTYDVYFQGLCVECMQLFQGPRVVDGWRRAVDSGWQVVPKQLIGIVNGLGDEDI